MTRTVWGSECQHSGQLHFNTGDPDRLDDMQIEYPSDEGGWVVWVGLMSTGGVGRAQEGNGLGEGDLELPFRIKHGVSERQEQ